MTPLQIRELFILKNGEPQSIELLDSYINFVLDNHEKNEISEYCEVHHILPNAQYPEYRKAPWNLIKLKYCNHIIAHEMLYCAYTTRQNHRTLNFMKSDIAKDHFKLSIASKKGWESLKNNKEKYEKWRRVKRSFPTQTRKKSAKEYWNTLTLSAYLNRCNINKSNWTPELKKWKSKSMSKYFKDNPQEIATRNQLRWDNMPLEKRKAFNDTMKIVNADPNKRKKAGDKIRERWSDPMFKEKMKTRKCFKLSFTLISPTGDVYKRDGFHEMINEFNFSPYLVNKFKNTDTPVESKHIHILEVRNTIGWKFIKH
jgi:hypothetical protein